MKSILFSGLPTPCRRGEDNTSPSASVRQKRQRKRRTPVEPVSPSLAALLAVTDIPRPTRRRQQRRRTPASVDSEDGLAGPLEVLLSPPDDCGHCSALPLLARTTSNDSIPSLGGDSSDTLSSLDTPSPALDEEEDEQSPVRRRRRRSSPVRRWLPSDAADAHPLVADPDDDADDERPSDYDDESPKPLQAQLPSRPLRSVFRSNLTASLRALRLAARSLSSSASSPSSDDALFVTRSMLAIDPNVPYTDERRPPLLEEMPSAELRRYLNPPPTTTTSTSSLLDGHPVSRRPFYSASIQMQTYKVYRIPQRQQHSANHSHHHQGQHVDANNGLRRPGMRQREMRENPDFIRIAVMEMAMRKCGKLDGQRPGRARWALPPRKPVTKPYEVGGNGVPLRWTAMTVE
ncbi:hypothetical protein CP532_6072 [Ophiocordyceps camponoti-leonardi (nom. inval.)]|nr:hypothetical protein CP532_6072 [Ophiocordyceps camponoti-leonardi (nom. inval.)]